MTKPHIVADAAIPLIDVMIGNRAHLTQVPGPQITREHLQHADALLVRTVTPVNRELLLHTPVRFVGSATAGTDHLQVADLTPAPVVCSASGANANAVAEYVLCTIARLQLDGQLPRTGLRVGIIGVGHVGSRLHYLLEQVGITPLVNDPPRAAQDPQFAQSALSTWHELDVITLHTPLTTQGAYPTQHLLDEAWLAAHGKPGCVIINTCRGEVFAADSLRRNPARRYCFDVWEHEPDVSLACVQQACLATPHIAGYSQEAKYRASALIFHQLCEFFGWPTPALEALLAQHLSTDTLAVPEARDWQHVVTAAFDPSTLSTAFKQALTTSPLAIATTYEGLRRAYPLRREFHAYRVLAPGLDATQRHIVKQLGFLDCL